MPCQGALAIPTEVNYNIKNVSPVTFNGNPGVVLSADTTAQPSNYPIAAVQTAFNAAAQGALVVGTAEKLSGSPHTRR